MKITALVLFCSSLLLADDIYLKSGNHLGNYQITDSTSTLLFARSINGVDSIALSDILYYSFSPFNLRKAPWSEGYTTQLITSYPIVQAQQDIKRVLRAGIEIANFLSTNNGSFAKQAGSTIGYLTELGTGTTTTQYFILGMEFNFTHTTFYRLDASYVSVDPYETEGKYQEQYGMSAFEIGLLPEFSYPINNNTIIRAYVGGSIGLGHYSMTHHFVSSTVIDSAIYSPFGEGPYSPAPTEEDFFALPWSLNFGASVYYERLMIDLRYSKTTTFLRGSNTIQKRYFIQVGVIL